MPNKKTPLYNYRSPRDYKVFNMGNKASPPFKLKKKKDFDFGKTVDYSKEAIEKRRLLARTYDPDAPGDPDMPGHEPSVSIIAKNPRKSIQNTTKVMKPVGPGFEGSVDPRKMKLGARPSKKDLKNLNKKMKNK